jgi:hypothetical protein
LVYRSTFRVQHPLDAWLRLRAPSALIAVVDKHATKKQMTMSSFTRAALLAALEADGVPPPPPPRPTRKRKQPEIVA